jgi:non-specific serine/threonine protein kinase
LTKGLRLQQIVSGFVKTDTGEEILIKDNPRLKAVEELLAELTPNHKVILWCSFIKDYEQLADVCKKLKIKHCFITGGMSARRKQESITKFRKDHGTRVIIANRGAGGIGINLVEASYSIIYSRNFSLAEELQSEARNHRGGSEIHERITKIDLCARGTYDERTLEALENKQNISDAIIDWASNKGAENE